MNWNESTLSGLGVALNEADLVGVHIDPASRTATVTLLVLSLDNERRAREIQLLLTPVSRVAASLRCGAWNDPLAAVLPLQLDTLSAAVQSFGGQPIYGWEFFDRHDEELALWGDRKSLDWRVAGAAPARHSICLFQEGLERHLDLCVWFDDLEVLDERGMRIDLAALIADGEGWWAALRNHDPRTRGHGLFPL